MTLQKPRGYPRATFPEAPEVRKAKFRWEHKPREQIFLNKVRKHTQTAVRKAAEVLILEML